MKKNTYITSKIFLAMFCCLSIVTFSTTAALAKPSELKEIVLSDTEFTELLLRSLEQNKDGALLLSVSESISVQALPDKIIFSAIINLNKVEKLNSDARKNIEKINGLLLFLDREQVNLTIYGQPAIRNGLFGIRDNFDIKLGPLPVSNEALRQLGIPVKNVNVNNLKLDGLFTKSIVLKQGSVTLKVR